MENKYIILSTKFNIQERKTKKNGTLYDAIFRIIDPADGKTKQKKLSGFKTKALAKQAHADFITKYCEMRQTNPFDKKKPEKDTPTVEELAVQYFASLPNQNKESSIYDKQNIFRLFVFPKFGDKKITALTKEALYQWQDELWATKNPKTNDFYSYAYLEKTRAHFNAFLAYCESRHGYKNYMTLVTKPKRKAPKTEMQIWDKETFEKFVETVQDPMYRCLFTLMFYTGRRKGELFALSPADIHIDEKEKQPYISFTKSITRKTIDGTAYKITTTKADKKSNVPICTAAVEAIKNYEGHSPFFFGGDNPLPENTVTRVFNRHCQKAEVEKIRLHDLRHSFVSMLMHLGANMMVIAELISDTPEQVAKTYAHLYESDKIAIINKL